MTGAGNQAGSRVIPAEAGAGGGAPASRQARDAGVSQPTPRRGGDGPPLVSVRAAEVASLQRWLARVWPAIALGGRSGQVGAVVQVVGDLLRPGLSVVAGVLTSAAASPGAAGPSVLGVSTPETALEPGPAPAPAPVPPDRGRTIYLIALGALLAFLGFVVWREFDVALRPWQHRH